MILEKFKWQECKDISDRLYHNNVYLSPYQKWDFLDSIKNAFNIHRIKDWIFSANVTYIAKDKDIVCVIPLQVNKHSKKVCLLGNLCGVGHLDFIYSPHLSESQFLEIISILKQIYSGYTFILDRISQYSLTHKYLQESKIYSSCESSTCVRIDIDSYENWYNSLSKSTRQNLRTAYNRIAREEKTLEVVYKVRELPDSKQVKDNLDLLAKRTVEHNKMSPKYEKLMHILKSSETFTKTLLSSPDFIGMNIYLDGQTLAICNGLVANDGRAIITRLSIETSLGVYCPGGLILNELIKIVTEKYPIVTSIDLSRGDEKYKYTYGGYEHYNYDYSLNL